jgi:hypothetical protein
MSCTSGIRGRRNRRQLRSWVMFVCVWCPSLLCGFASRSLLEVWSCLCMIHMKQRPRDATDTLPYLGGWQLGTQLIHCLIWGVHNLGRNWYIALSGGFATWDATDTLPYLGGSQLGTQLIRFLDRGTQLLRPRHSSGAESLRVACSARHSGG